MKNINQMDIIEWDCYHWDWNQIGGYTEENKNIPKIITNIKIDK